MRSPFAFGEPADLQGSTMQQCWKTGRHLKFKKGNLCKGSLNGLTA